MYCSNCGEKFNDNPNFCPHCGHSISKKVEKEYTSQKPNIGHWSWGGFGLTWIYLYSMKYRWWWLFLILMLMTNGVSKANDGAVSWTGIIIQLIIMIALGIEGRKIAYKNHHWDSNEQFLKAQRIWDIWGIILFIVINSIIFGLSFINY